MEGICKRQSLSLPILTSRHTGLILIHQPHVDGGWSWPAIAVKSPVTHRILLHGDVLSHISGSSTGSLSAPQLCCSCRLGGGPGKLTVLGGRCWWVRAKLPCFPLPAVSEMSWHSPGELLQRHLSSAWVQKPLPKGGQ